MKAHFIKGENYNIAFFPESKRFFKVNDKGISLIKMIENNDKDEDICEQIEIDLINLQKYKVKINEYNKSPEINNFKQLDKKILNRLVIHITNSCNLKCIYCYANGGVYHSEEACMDERTLDILLERFYGEFDIINMVQFFGGEPLIDINMIKLACEKIRKIDQKRDYNTLFGLVTNATLINDEFIELVKKYQINVTISYDGDIKVNNLLRVYPNGKGTSDIILKNAKILLEKTNLLGTVEVTYTKFHYENNVTIMDIIKHIKKELPNIPIHLIPAGGNESCNYALEDLTMFKDSIDDIFSENIDSLYEFNYSLSERIINALINKDVRSNYICDAGFGTLSVNVKGDVYPCFMFTDQKNMCLGTIKDENIFYSNDFKNKLELITKFSYKNNNIKCKNCFIKNICNGCLGLNMMHSGNAFKLDEATCEMFQDMTERVIINLALLLENKDKGNKHV